MREWFNRLRGRASGFDAALDDEIRFHLETRAAELETSGLSRSAALLQARREFGSTALAGEESRAAWEFRWLRDLACDLRHALRVFRRSPAFTLTAVASLALGIGATSAIFTSLDSVLWRPLPVRDPYTLVNFSITREGREPETDLPAAFGLQLASSGIFEGMIVNEADGLSFAYDGRAERIVGEAVSPDYFTVLGIAPILGEAFTSGVRAGRWAPEAVLSYNFWKRRFGGDPRVIGRAIRLNTVSFTIVGVTPPSFFGLVRATDSELRIPLLPPGGANEHMALIGGNPQRWSTTAARLKPGVALGQAEAAADAQLQEFLRTTPIARFRDAGLRHLHLSSAARGYDDYVSVFHTPLYVLLVLVAVVLLIACSNVANMLLARATARARELAVRTSIGAGRLRLVRQMLAESLLLAALGGAAAIPVAWWAAGALFRFLPQGHVSLAIDLRPDGRALLFTFLVSLLTGILFGLVPALQGTRCDLAAALKSDSNASVGAGAGARFRKALLISQIAFSMLLLVAAGVFVRTLAGLRPTDYRANPDRILLFTMKPQPENYTDQRKFLLAGEILRRVAALGGVQSAALAEGGPMGSRQSRAPVQFPSGKSLTIDNDAVSPGFFDTIGIPRIAGRDFNANDGPGSPPVIIVNQALARTAFPNQNPIGRTLKIPRGKSDGTYQIVGVVADAHYYDPHGAPAPFLWTSLTQAAIYMPTLHVRTASPDTAAIVAAVRREFDAVDKGFPVFNIKTMSMRIEDSLSRERIVANLAGAFGLVALALSAVGLYGVLAYSVSRRTREIGVRMALGADSASVIAMVAREALVLVVAGSAAGILLAIAALRTAAHYLPGISPVDPPIAAACTLAMFAIAALAVAIPAIRGSRIDPLCALRDQ